MHRVHLAFALALLLVAAQGQLNYIVNDVVFNQGNSIREINVVGLTSNLAVVCYSESIARQGRCNKLTRSGTALTAGEFQTFHLGNSGGTLEATHFRVAAFGTSTIVACYQDPDADRDGVKDVALVGSGDHPGWCSVLAIDSDGTWISSGGGAGSSDLAMFVDRGQSTGHFATASFDATTGVVCYTKAGGGGGGTSGCRIMSISGGTTKTLTMETEAELSATSLRFPTMARLDASRVLLCYVSGSNPNPGECRVIAKASATTLDVTPASMEFHAELTTGNGYLISVAALDDTTVVICHGDDPNTKAHCKVLTVSGTVATLGGSVEIYSGGDNKKHSVSALDATHAVNCFEKAKDHVICTTLTVDGTSISASAGFVFPGVDSYSNFGVHSVAAFDSSSAAFCYGNDVPTLKLGTCAILSNTPPPSSPPGVPPPLPPPSPLSPLEDDPCFSSAAMVVRADGRSARIDELAEGDEIVAATAEGGMTVDTVSPLSISKPSVMATFVKLTTATNATLLLTATHHLPVGNVCCATLKQAKDVGVGELVWTVINGAGATTQITAKAISNAKGLHSPVLAGGGFPIIDGIITSFDSIEKVTLAKHGLKPLLAACKATATCDTFRNLFAE